MALIKQGIQRVINVKLDSIARTNLWGKRNDPPSHRSSNPVVFVRKHSKEVREIVGDAKNQAISIKNCAVKERHSAGWVEAYPQYPMVSVPSARRGAGGKFALDSRLGTSHVDAAGRRAPYSSANVNLPICRPIAGGKAIRMYEDSDKRRDRRAARKKPAAMKTFLEPIGKASQVTQTAPPASMIESTMLALAELGREKLLLFQREREFCPSASLFKRITVGQKQSADGLSVGNEYRTEDVRERVLSVIFEIAEIDFARGIESRSLGDRKRGFENWPADLLQDRLNLSTNFARETIHLLFLELWAHCEKSGPIKGSFGSVEIEAEQLRLNARFAGPSSDLGSRVRRSVVEQMDILQLD